jgi:hypothetical protein
MKSRTSSLAASTVARPESRKPKAVSVLGASAPQNAPSSSSSSSYVCSAPAWNDVPAGGQTKSGSGYRPVAIAPHARRMF